VKRSFQSEGRHGIPPSQDLPTRALVVISMTLPPARDRGPRRLPSLRLPRWGELPSIGGAGMPPQIRLCAAVSLLRRQRRDSTPAAGPAPDRPFSARPTTLQG